MWSISFYLSSIAYYSFLRNSLYRISSSLCDLESVEYYLPKSYLGSDVPFYQPLMAPWGIFSVFNILAVGGPS